MKGLKGSGKFPCSCQESHRKILSLPAFRECGEQVDVILEDATASWDQKGISQGQDQCMGMVARKGRKNWATEPLNSPTLEPSHLRAF